MTDSPATPDSKNTVSTAAVSIAKCDDEISRCVVQMLLKEPFFGHLLSGVVRVFSDDVPTVGVGLRDGYPYMIINPAFFLLSLKTPSERIAVVKHETLHLALKHVRRGRLLSDHWLGNIAADLVVNQFIGTWKLPTSAVTLASFPDLDLKPNQSMEVYYAALTKLAGQMTAAGWRAPNADGLGDGAESGFDPSGLKSPQSADTLARLARYRWHSDHSKWRTGDDGLDGSEAVLDDLIAKTANRVGVKGWGSLPGPLREMVAAVLEKRKPQVDWRRTVRIFSNSARRSVVVSTQRRPSKRYGTFPGIRLKRKQRLAVAVDTSGSVSDHELSLFFTEIHGIWRSGAEVHVIECDAVVQRVWIYKGVFPKAVAGRGGTMFDPVFVYLRQNPAIVWDGCLYLTDGIAPPPVVKPACKVLWVISHGTGESQVMNGKVPFGRTVHLKT